MSGLTSSSGTSNNNFSNNSSQNGSSNQNAFASGGTTALPYIGATQGLNNLLAALQGISPAATNQQALGMNVLAAAADNAAQNGLPGMNFLTGAGNTAAAIPGLTAGILNNANTAFGNANNTISTGLAQLNNELAPYLAGNYTNPFNNPAMAKMLGYMTNSITNQVGSQFAGGGDGSMMNSPAYATALAYGIGSGEMPVLANQYNQLVGQQQNAINSLFGGTMQGAQGYQNSANSLANIGLNAAGLNLGAANTGINVGQLMPQLAMQSAMFPLQAANAINNVTPQNIATLLGETLPVASAFPGGTSTQNQTGNTTSQQTGTNAGTSQTQYTIDPSILQALMGNSGLLGSGGLFGAGGLFGTSGALSDRRAKTDIEQVGELYDGTPVYRFRYLTGGPMQIGLMAQDVEHFAPEAVGEISGVKFVDYKRATERAARIA